MWQGLDLGRSKVSRRGGARASADELGVLYDTMLAYGFRKDHVQEALQVNLRQVHWHFRAML
jgi:hypothetical protein